MLNVMPDHGLTCTEQDSYEIEYTNAEGKFKTMSWQGLDFHAMCKNIWRPSLQPMDEQGYVIVAVNSDTVNYQDCARTLAKTIRYWDPSARICLVTDSPYTDPLYDHYRQIVPDANPFANDAQLFRLTPFRETIKLEADMLIVSPIDHWWTQFRHRDVVISTGCRDWQDRVSTARHYRRVFDVNNLPDVYNAVTYWRRSETAKEFLAG
jgi:hypothetical protein